MVPSMHTVALNPVTLVPVDPVPPDQTFVHRKMKIIFQKSAGQIDPHTSETDGNSFYFLILLNI